MYSRGDRDEGNGSRRTARWRSWSSGGRHAGGQRPSGADPVWQPGSTPGTWAHHERPAVHRAPVSLYGMRKPKNTVRGTDVAGVVEAVGAAVTDFVPVTRSSAGAWVRSPTTRRLRRRAGAEAANILFEQAAAVPRRLVALRCVTTATSRPPEGADQRRSGVLRSADREVARSRGHRGGPQRQRRARPIDRR